MIVLGFLIDSELFAVDVTYLQKVARKIAIMPVPTAQDSVAGITNIKGRVVTILCLAGLLGQRCAEPHGLRHSGPLEQRHVGPLEQRHGEPQEQRHTGQLGQSHVGVVSLTDDVNALIFKMLSDGSDQMGLLIDNPCDLVAIEDGSIIPLPLEADAQERKFISGVADVGGKLYRIVDIPSIMNK